MANSEAESETLRAAKARQRQIALERAIIETDSANLRRTARFTDGSVRELAMHWRDVKRVVAFRRDVFAAAVLSIAITDAANVVVLDERMEGWAPLIEFLPRHFALAPSFTEWLDRSAREPLSSAWTILFRA